MKLIKICQMHLPLLFKYNNFIPITTTTTYQSNNLSSNLPSNNCFWNPTRELCNLLNEFNNKILFDYPKVPCAYCSILLMQDSIKRLPYDENERYTLVRAFPQIDLSTRINRKSVKQVAVCSSCLKEPVKFQTSYGKYIKLRMLCPNPRFRLHWYWPHWSYLNLEKRRNFQNSLHPKHQSRTDR